MTTHGVFPKGSKAGLQHMDHGEQTVSSTAATSGVAGSRLRVFQDQWQWKCGVLLKDWRYVVRIPNIDISNLVAKSSAADLVELMIKAIHRIPSLKLGKPVFYMNRTVYGGLRRMARSMSSGVLEVEKGLTQFGTPTNWMTYLGVPIRRCDAILNTESVVS